MELLLFIVLTISSYAHSTANDTCKEPTDTFEPWKRPYLPQTIEPTRYTLNLFPDFYHNASSFKGDMLITFKVINATDVILVHQKDLDITTTIIIRTTCAQKVNVTRAFKYDEYWVIQMNETMQASDCSLTLFLKYKGDLTIPSRYFGFFKSTYFNNITRKDSWLMATYFKPSSSRSAFPSLDEPQFKVPFYIGLRHWKNFTALSNMDVMKVENRKNTIWEYTHFALSKQMSSYLVTFIISDFSFKNNTLVSGQKNRVWARPDQLDKVDFALNATRVVEKYLRQEFIISFPLQKLDHFALPEFGPIGMESWGLIAYKESLLLIDTTKKGYFDMQNSLAVIARELAHNYFGNLVTCKYWNHLWLNEGLAAFYSIRAVTEVDPTSSYKELHLANVLEQTMTLEAANQTHALVPVLSSPYQPTSLFNLILDGKGPVILRMVENFMGTESFRKGIRRYLRDSSYKSVETSHLWAALQKEFNDSSLNLEEVMRAWVDKPGFPVVLVQPVPLHDDQFMAVQERFLSNPLAVEDCGRWHVPLNYRTKAGKEGLVWVNKVHVTFKVPLNSPEDWIQFNHDATGYYRVNYHQTLWERIVNQLNENHTVFSKFGRWKLLSDAASLVKAEQLGYDTLLSLSRYASEERGYAPWQKIVSILHEMSLIGHTAILDRFQRYVLNLTSSLMDELKVKDELSNVIQLLRPRIMELACVAGHRVCISNTSKIFRPWIRTQTSDVPESFKQQVYCIGIINSNNEHDWNTVFKRFRVSLTAERSKLLGALTCTKSLTLLKRLLEYAVNETTTHQDSVNAINGIAWNPKSESCVFKWLQLNYTDTDTGVRARLSETMIIATVNNVVTREQRDQVHGFLKNYQFVRQDSIPGYLKTMERNIHWMDRNLPVIDSWLENNFPN